MLYYGGRHQALPVYLDPYKGLGFFALAGGSSHPCQGRCKIIRMNLPVIQARDNSFLRFIYFFVVVLVQHTTGPIRPV
jgi:hypothetical protein